MTLTIVIGELEKKRRRKVKLFFALPKRQPPNVSSGETPLSMNGCIHGLWPTTFRFFRLSRRLPTSNCHSHLVSFSTAEPRPGRISSPLVADVHTLSFRLRPPSSKSLWTGKQDREREGATGGGVGATPRGHWRKRVGVEKGGKRTRWASFFIMFVMFGKMDKFCCTSQC